jgi:C_GCAxxG_C_C family probable redox protein
MSRAESAEKYFYEGYACSQAVALAFVDLTDVSFENMSKLSLPLGGGLARLRTTCGAISGMSLIVGLLFSDSKASEENKLAIYERVRVLTDRFIAERKTINCKELLEAASLEVEIGGKPDARTSEYYKKRPCGAIVYLAAKILEEYLEQEL